MEEKRGSRKRWVTRARERGGKEEGERVVDEGWRGRGVVRASACTAQCMHLREVWVRYALVLARACNWVAGSTTSAKAARAAVLSPAVCISSDFAADSRISSFFPSLFLFLPLFPSFRTYDKIFAHPWCSCISSNCAKFEFLRNFNFCLFENHGMGMKFEVPPFSSAPPKSRKTRGEIRDTQARDVQLRFIFHIRRELR